MAGRRIVVGDLHIDLKSHLVVHAGLRPNVELHSQTTGDLTRLLISDN